jgi:hypothetical protein
MIIAKIAESAKIAKICFRVADRHCRIFNFGNYPILAIMAICDEFNLLGNAR